MNIDEHRRKSCSIDIFKWHILEFMKHLIGISQGISWDFFKRLDMAVQWMGECYGAM